MPTIVITQARMTSTRLPGKVMRPILDKPLLAYHLERLRRIPSVDAVVVATTLNATDDCIEAFCHQNDIGVWRGPEDDVLTRYHGAAVAHGADVVVRVTSDCPLIDPEISDLVIRRFLENRATLDYVSNTVERTYPRGLDTEVFSRDALELAFREARQPHEREHVTPFIYQHPERFRIAQVTDARDRSEDRWTVDTPEDFAFVRRVLEALVPEQPEFGWHEVLAVLQRHPDWRMLNAMVVQKRLGE
ncbi:MAG: glycosyltransferase family protein [Magnetococcales bacterium]|nr:glycosyltransferase family protein [Magnetococcales bacterium]